MRLIATLSLTFLLSGLCAQETAKDVYDKITNAQKELTAGGARPDKAKVDEFQASVKEALSANSKVLAEGDGVFYRGRLQMLARDTKSAAESFKAYIDSKPTSDLVHEARVIAAQLSMNGKENNARELLAPVKADKLTDAGKKTLEGLQKQLKADDTRNGLTGKGIPAFAPVKTLNAPADFGIASCKGKVVVMDFWATWCPPCLREMPGLTEIHRKYGDKVVVIAASSEPLQVLRDFRAAKSLKFAIVRPPQDLAEPFASVASLPTTFLIDRAGVIRAYHVGFTETDVFAEEIDKLLAEK